MASLLVGSSPDRAVRVRDLAGDIVLCSWSDTSLSTQVYKRVHRCTNGYTCVQTGTQVYKRVPANLMLG